MLVHFGTGSYTVKSFTPSELGLPLSYTQEAEFRIKQRYFEIYWIPIFAIGMAYSVKHRGGSVEYEVSPEIEESMRQLGYPKWKKLLAFAAPLAAILVLLGIGAMEKVSRAQWERHDKEFYQQRNSELKAFEEDPNGYARYAAIASHYDSLLNKIVEESAMEPVEIDTTKMGLLKMLTKMKRRNENDPTPYTLENSIIFNRNAQLNSIAGSPIELPSLRTAFSNATQITTYHLEYLLDSTQHRSITQANNLRVSFDNASLKEYFIATNIKGLVIPEIIRNNQGDEGFNSGYALVEVKVYHIGTSKLIESFDVLAYNDEEVSVRNRRNTNYGSSGNDYSISARDMLIVNLNTNIKSEVLEKLNLSTKRTLEEEVSSPPSADDLKDSKPSTSA